MTEKDTSPHEWSRRTVLRRTAIGAAAAGIGVPALSGTGAATVCPRTPGYWMNHDWPGDGDDPDVKNEDTGLEQVNERVPGVFFDTESDGQEFLRSPPRGDKGHIMATHLIAFVLNSQFRNPVYPDDHEDPSDPCLGNPVADVDGDGEPESISRIACYARKWLMASEWSDEGRPLRSWEVEPPSDSELFGCGPNGEDDTFVTDGEKLKDYIDAFNNNNLEIEGCDC